MSTFAVSRKTQCGVPSNVSGSPILSSLAEGSPGSSGLRESGEAIEGFQRRTGLVATSSSSLERQDSDPETDSDSDLVRCLSNWLGCNVRQGEHWRLLVPAGENNAHQLPGTPGCRFSNEGLFEGIAESQSCYNSTTPQQ